MNDEALNEISINNSNILSGLTPVTTDALSCIVPVSDYKWLTPSLINSQIQYGVSPYYTCQIVDDIFNPTGNQTINYPIQGSAVTAPDGSILAVGLDNSNNVGFWKIMDGSKAANWNTNPTIILENNSANRNAANNYSIKCSDYIKGTYKIDIYFFGNFSGPGNLKILHYHSFDGGNTWNSNETVNTTFISSFGSPFNIYVCGGKPYLNADGFLISTVFYTGLNNRGFYDINYQQFPGTGTSFGTAVVWSQRDINTQEWVVHSFDTEYINNTFYIVFSGYHSFYDATNQIPSQANYNLYVTKILNLTNSTTTDIWAQAFPIITFDSSSIQNVNTFEYPKIYYDGQKMNLICYGEVLSGYDGTLSVYQNNSAFSIISQYVYICESYDFKNFSALNPLSLPNGTYISAQNANGIVQQGSNYYIIANQIGTTSFNLVTMVQNNNVADVSLDILNYTINDTQQGASTLTITIGNANNKWYAGTPSTQPGYQAIIKNAKVNIFQGYYDVNSNVPEVAPKDIYYIDDIQQNVSSNTNEFTIAARNIYKKLESYSAPYTYNFVGLNKYSDFFNDTSSNQNYNFTAGTWNIAAGELMGSNPSNTTITALLSVYEENKPNTIFSIIASLPTTFPEVNYQLIVFYPYYVDANNFVSLEVVNTGSVFIWTTAIVQAGVITVISSDSFSFGIDNNNFPFMFVRNSYYKVQCYVGSDINDGKDQNAFATATALGPEINFSNFFSEVGYIGVGGINTSPTNTSTLAFQNIKYTEFDYAQSMQELITTLATKASVFSYKFETVFEDYFYTNTNYTGTYKLINRNLILSPGNTATKNDLTFGDFEIKFNAKVTPTNGGTNFGIHFNFRDNGTNKYVMKIDNQFADAGTSYTSVRLYASISGTEYLLAGSGGFGGQYSNNLNFDITKQHEYKVISNGYFYFLAVDKEVVFGWMETSTSFYTQKGNIGFKAFNGTASISSVIGTEMYTQIGNYALNVGDNLENSIDTVVGVTLNFFFSDLLGRFKVIQLDSNTASNYTYQNQLILQQVDLSDKEFSNQVVVNGTNVTVTINDPQSIANSGYTKTLVINDSNITTYSDALLRAQYELINAKIFNTQYSPKQVLNVGSEIFDVVTVVNTGNNSTNVNANIRIYSQEIDVTASPPAYYLTLDTGQL